MLLERTVIRVYARFLFKLEAETGCVAHLQSRIASSNFLFKLVDGELEDSVSVCIPAPGLADDIHGISEQSNLCVSSRFSVK